MDLRLIEKFYRNECTSEEARKVVEWFRSRELQRDQEKDMKQIWEEMGLQTDTSRLSYDPKLMLDSIHQQMEMRPTMLRNLKKSGEVSGSYLSIFLKSAAVIFLVILMGWLMKETFHPQPVEKAPKLVSLEAPSGIKLTKILPDGSKVILNSRSSITYDEGFTHSSREITLNGEGYFEVVKDASRPFTVHTGKISTTAFGTSFNIRYRPSEPSTEVSLATGKVQVKIKGSTGTSAAELLPGERMAYSSDTETLEVGLFDFRETFAWKEGILYFKETSLIQVVQRLEDWYGVKIRIEGTPDQSKNQKWSYTGRFENQSLENVLTGIAFIKDFNFEIEGKNIKIIFQ